MSFNSNYDDESYIFSTMCISVDEGNIKANFYASYIADVVQKQGKLREEMFETRIRDSISINYCPMCGRKLIEDV